MGAIDRIVRQSVSLPSNVARRVQSLAKAKRVSANRILVDLIETGLDARERERKHFLELAEALAQTRDRAEQERLKQELARLTFGE